MGLHHPFLLPLVLAFSNHGFQLLNYFVLPRIIDEGSLPEMRIWSILLIKSDLKWCIHLSICLFTFNRYKTEIKDNRHIVDAIYTCTFSSLSINRIDINFMDIEFYLIKRVVAKWL